MTFIKGETPDGAIPFKKGESGNPNGRPPGKTFKSILNDLLDLKATDEDMSDEEIKKLFPDGKVTNREILMAKLLLTAKKDGESKSMERLMNRVDGKPIETVNNKVEIDTAKKINLSMNGEEINLSTDSNDSDPSDAK